MHLSLIQEGEELEKKSTVGPWFYDGMCYLFSGTPQDAQMIVDTGEDGDDTRMRGVGANLPLDTNAKLICFLRNNAKDLLEAARELALLKQKYPKYVQRSR